MHYRQGDVLLERIEPKGKSKLKKHETNVVALGEATGHNHAVIDGTVLVDEQGNLFVEAQEGTSIRHIDAAGNKAEHEALDVAPGLYKVHIETEYTPEGWNRVAD